MWNFVSWIPAKYDQEELKVLLNHRLSHKHCFLQWHHFTRLTLNTPYRYYSVFAHNSLQFHNCFQQNYSSDPSFAWKSKRRENSLHCRDYANFHALFALPKLQAMGKEFSYWVPSHLNDSADSTAPHSSMYLTYVVQLLPATDINIPH